jgi:outer membrane receptor protein involved in Fe transport
MDAAAQSPPRPEPDPFIVEFPEDDDERVGVLKTLVSLQEAPAILTVIDDDQIENLGHRTLADVLQTIPGFEGDRWDLGGWFKTHLTRGLPYTTLILRDGVNIVSPLTNRLTLDRKIPLDNLRRVEVISGPGSVLWGSNALLGVVNLVTHNGRTAPGLRMRVGGGHGPGEMGAFRTFASWGGMLADGAVDLYISASWFSTLGPQFEIGQPIVFGPLPEPGNDGPSFIEPNASLTDPAARDHYVDVTGRLGIGPVTIGFSTGWERENRELSPSGAPLFGELVSVSTDTVHSAWLRYRDRFDADRIGLSVQTYVVHWMREDSPFTAYPSSSLLEQGGTSRLESDGTWRLGLTTDLDWSLPGGHRLLLGGEVYGDMSSALLLTTFDPLSDGSTSPEGCTQGFIFDPALDPDRPCMQSEKALPPTSRVTGGLYALDEWTVLPELKLNFGVRGQFSSGYDPALSLSGGLVAELHPSVFMKVVYQEGFRAPDFQSTKGAQGLASLVTVESNPNLDVERSRSAMAELNAYLFVGDGAVREWYVRAGYSYTSMDGVISQATGRYENAAARDIHSVEFLSRLRFRGSHELFLSYGFVDVVDSELGRLRNIANHVINAGGHVGLLNGQLHLAAVFTWRGAMEDLNRTRYSELVESLGGSLAVPATGLEVTQIDGAPLLRLGIEGRRLFDVLDLTLWVYNALDTDWSDADLYFDGRVQSRPQPKPRVSFWAEARVHW